jgi:hypothetical protein
MKLLLIVVDADHAPDVERVLEASHVPGYTEVPNALGKGRTGRKLGTRAFPGSSTMYFAALPDGECHGLCDELRRLKASTGPEEGLKAYVFDTMEVI